jgi:hypothetical protein
VANQSPRRREGFWQRNDSMKERKQHGYSRKAALTLNWREAR